jgi:hypothetical protein
VYGKYQSVAEKIGKPVYCKCDKKRYVHSGSSKETADKYKDDRQNSQQKIGLYCIYHHFSCSLLPKSPFHSPFVKGVLKGI